MERSLTKTHKYLLAIFVFLMLAGGVFRLYNAGVLGGRDQKKDIEFKTLPEKTIRVHVKGEVRKPGVYTLKRGARWIDAVEAAGGGAERADFDGLNLAGFLRDGMEVVIPAGRAKRGGGGQEGGARTAAKVKAGEFININTAGESDLTRLPGVGTVIASRIVETRERRGDFKKKQEIMLVPGIGKAKYIELEAFIVVRQP